MQRRFRLRRSQDLDRARRSGRSYAHPLLVLVACRNEQSRARVGVVAGRAVGSAVKRNRAKRLLRAAMRSLVGTLVPGWDVVLIARAPLVESSYVEVQEALAILLRRAELVPVS